MKQRHTDEMPPNHRTGRYGTIAFSIAVSALVLIVGGFLVPGEHERYLSLVFILVFLLGIPSSFVLSLIASRKDVHRGFGLAAMLLTVVNLFWCLLFGMSF
jgi:hypothetical membrane protein